MESLKALIEQLISDRTLIMATLSQVRNKGETCTKVQIKPVELKGKLHYQFASYIGTKVEHRNVPAELAAEDMTLLFRESYRQGLLCTVEADYQVLISKKFKVSILTKSPSKKEEPDLAHNRRKRYVLEDGEPVPFLVELGIMNREGKVLAKRYDKFRQINRFWRWLRMCLPICQRDGH